MSLSFTSSSLHVDPHVLAVALFLTLCSRRLWREAKEFIGFDGAAAHAELWMNFANKKSQPEESAPLVRTNATVTTSEIRTPLRPWYASGH